jgi:tetratricopeptide (TPR) repeat protein
LTNRGRADAAISYLDRSVRAARHSGRPLRLAHSLLNLANAEGEAGRLGPSDRHNTEALAIYRRHEAPYQRSLVLANLAENALDRADPHAAVEYADRALGLLGDIEDATGVASALIVRARALLMTADHEPARCALRRALAILEPNDDPRTTQVHALLNNITSPTTRAADRRRPG